MLGGVAIEQGGNLAHGILSGSNLYIGHAFGFLLGQVLAEHSFGAQLKGFGNELVAIGLCAFHGNEEMAVFDFA